MRHIFALSVSVCLVSVSAITWAASQQNTAAASSPQKTANTASPSIEETLKAVRGDLQSNRADIMAKNMTLTSAQAAKFWPMFEAYQKEQNVIMDDQLQGLQKYVENFETLDDAGAMALINAHFDRDARMSALHQKWFADFQEVLGTKLAVRAMQIDRRLSLAHQMQFAASIPLAH